MDIHEYKRKEGLPDATLTHYIVKDLLKVHKLANLNYDEQKIYEIEIAGNTNLKKKTASVTWQEADILDRCGVETFTHEGHGYVKFMVRFDAIKNMDVSLFEEYISEYKEAEIELIRRKNQIENEFTEKFNQKT